MALQLQPAEMVASTPSLRLWGELSESKTQKMSTPEVLACLQNAHNIFGRCHLNDLLLVPLPLDPAVPLPYVSDIALNIPNDLHLDMVEVVKMPLHKTWSHP
jgi:hypothetical protein